MPSDQTFVIVGASLAGAKAADTLRSEGFDGNVSPGLYVPAAKVGALARFVAQWVSTLRPDVARHYHRPICPVAMRQNFVYEPATGQIRSLGEHELFARLPVSFSVCHSAAIAIACPP